MEDSLFLLLRIGLEIEHPSVEAANRMASLSCEQWTELKEIAERQSVDIIALDGLIRLIQEYGKESINNSFSANEWKAFFFEWMGRSLKMEQANVIQKEVLNDLAQKWTDAGCRVMVMKGHASGLLYPNPNHRSKGDIDCYLFEDYAKGNDIAREVGAEVDESWYKHSVISFKEETFENHQFFVHTRDGNYGKRLEKELENALKVEDAQFAPLSEYVICPPVQWTAMFLTYHACAHFVSEGLNLKQVLDWAMFLRKHQFDVNWSRFYEFCDGLHLGRFADVATAIAKYHLGIQITNGAIRTESPYTERVLESTLNDNDYVFGSGKGNWYNRFHLVRNLWTYRWKYRDIYQISPLRQFWYYATGFIFKTE